MSPALCSAKLSAAIDQSASRTRHSVSFQNGTGSLGSSAGVLGAESIAAILVG